MMMAKDMTINQYANAIAERINGKSCPVEKTNGIVKYGITKENGTNITPTVYVEDWYNNSIPVEEAAMEIEEMIEKNRVNNFDLGQVEDYENVKPMLRARLYNKATKAEVFRKVDEYDELIIIPCIKIENFKENGTSGSIKITNRLLEIWGVSKEDVIDTALSNSAKETSFRDMNTLIMELMMGMPSREIDENEVPEMLVVTNKDRMYGAVAVLFEKERLRKMYPNGYAVLPSSVHEMIVVPYTPNCESELTSLVGLVNTNEVLPEEVLGNKAYIFAA